MSDVGRNGAGEIDALRDRLTAAAEGLLYPSEDEHPFAFVVFPDAGGAPLTPERVAALAGAPGEDAEEVTLERFFAPAERAHPSDPASLETAPRFRALRETLAAELPDVRAFRVGRVHVRCFLVGRTKSGKIAGVETRALET